MVHVVITSKSFSGINLLLKSLISCIYFLQYVYFICTQISMADFYVFNYIDGTVRTHFPAHYDPKDFPKLAAHMERMKQIPQIKEWLEKRPKTEY